MGKFKRNICTFKV